jgi:hypothetical protein
MARLLGALSSARSLAILNWCSHVLLGIGLLAPCMTVIPRMDPLHGLGRWLGLVDEPRSYSIATGVLQLVRGGNVAIGVVLLVFSVLFPIAKLVVFRVALADARRGRPAGRARDVAARYGRYSMADVFVVALTVIVSKSFPGGTTVDVRWGAFAFAAAALLSMAVARGVARL